MTSTKKTDPYPITQRNRTSDGRLVVIRAYGRDEVYLDRNGLEMFQGYVGDGRAEVPVSKLPPALWAQHQILMAFWRTKYGTLLECPLRWDGGWKALTGGAWQPIDGLPSL